LKILNQISRSISYFKETDYACPFLEKMQVHGVEFGNGGGEEPPRHQWSRRRRIRDVVRHLSPMNQSDGGGVS